MVIDPRSPEFEATARAVLKSKQASEIVRRYQQGFGKPIISGEIGEYRVVAVGKSVKWSKGWRFFTDFALDHLKDKIGRPWAVQAQRDGKSHPIFDWLKTMSQTASELRRPGRQIFSSSCRGHLGALWRLGYALYLIEHHDQLDEKLIKRLRSSRSFFSAYHETRIAAAFAVGGLDIKMAEIRRSSFPTPEFWATSRKGRKFAVEAKRKSNWKSDTSSVSLEFKNELRQWLRDQIYACSKKRLNDPVYCFELSLDAGFDESQWTEVAAYIVECLKEAQDIRVRGDETRPAYVIITNDADVLSATPPEINRFAQLTAFNMSNWFEVGEEVETEKAFDAQDEHREIATVFKCYEEVDEIPQSFDGVPVFFDDEGNELPIQVKIGTQIEYPDDSDRIRRGVVYDICSTGNEAKACVESDGEHHIVAVPLLPHEIEAVAKYGDAVFGKPETKPRNLNGDPLAFYDWILGVYQDYDRKALLIQLGEHPMKSEYEKLDLKKLRIRAAREVTKAAIRNSGRLGQV